MKERIYNVVSLFPRLMRRLQCFLLEIRFYSRYKRRVQWKNPQSFYDKIIWMSCYADTSLWTWLADKYRVREFVAKRCGEKVLTTLYGVYSHASEIDYALLPDRFVMKTNNGCASNFLVKDKGNLDISSLNRRFEKWMKYPYGEVTGQLHYSAIEPKIIVEELLQQKTAPNVTLIDYKFFCFNGNPSFCHVISDRKFNTHECSEMVYDMQWNKHAEVFGKNVNISEDKLQCPSCFDEMKDIARKLSEGINFVRVDLYEVNGRVYFGEMTFMPGWDSDFTEDVLLSWGKKIDIKNLPTALEMRTKLGL